MNRWVGIHGTSLAVQQFVAIVRGSHQVVNRLDLRVEWLGTEERVCPCCEVKSKWDVAVGVPPTAGSDGSGGLVKLAVGWCRVCGAEVWSNG